MRTALITGVTGQDGSYLAELLLARGYTVHGVVRRASTFNTHRIDHLYRDPHDAQTRFFLHHGDLSDASRMLALLEKTTPDEVYHLAAQSHVRVSFEEPAFTGDVTGMGTVRLLEAIRLTGLECRFYQASSSEMFGSFPHGLSVTRDGGELPNLLAAADLVLCRGGYGSMHEATAGGAMVLAAPAQRKTDDQAARIEGFAECGSCELIDNVAPVDFAARIVRALHADPDRQRTAVWTEALDEVGNAIMRLACDRSEWRRRQGRYS